MGNGGAFVTVRAFYRKQGRVKFISHLDMTRCVSRALKRSRLPVWHTMGFNPHIYITFALPLSLGCESICESFDFRLVGDASLDAAKDRLNAVLPEGIQVYALAPAVGKPEEITWAEYEIEQEFDRLSPADVLALLGQWQARPEILTCKKTKKGERTIDIKPHFSIISATVDESLLRLKLRCAAGTEQNINPSLVLDAFARDCDCAPDWMRMVRTAILDQNERDFA